MINTILEYTAYFLAALTIFLFVKKMKLNKESIEAFICFLFGFGGSFFFIVYFLSKSYETSMSTIVKAILSGNETIIVLTIVSFVFAFPILSFSLAVLIHFDNFATINEKELKKGDFGGKC